MQLKWPEPSEINLPDHISVSAGASPVSAKTHLHGSAGVSPAFRTKRAGRPRSFGLHLTEMRPVSAHRVPSHATGPSSAFSLIELLVVMAIIAILSVLATAGLNSISRATKLASAAQRLGDQIALARQTAVARNLPVEVRLYKLPEFDSTTGGASLWRGAQIFIMDGTNAVPASRRLLFPHRVIISENGTVSPLLQNSATGLGAEIIPTSNVGAFSSGNVRYKSFTIRPNGTLTASNSIPDLNWFFTLHQENDPKPDSLKPANFVTIQINPVTSKVTILRP